MAGLPQMVTEMRKPYLERAIRKTMEKLGLPSFSVGEVEELLGVATAPSKVTVKDVAFVIKIHPEIVPPEIAALNQLNKICPQLVPKVLYADVEKGILVMPYYPYPSLQRIIMDDYPTNTKLEAFKVCYSSLFNALYEITVDYGSTNPYHAYINPIRDRLNTWINSGEKIAVGETTLDPIDILTKRLYINNIDIGKARNLIAELDIDYHKFVCPFVTGIHGDPNFTNFLCEPYPPFRRKILDWTNYAKGDPAIDAGKVLHWNSAYSHLYEWWMQGCTESDIISKLKMEVKVSSNKIQIYYNLPRSDLSRKLDCIIGKLFMSFSERHKDKNSAIRVRLGKARAHIRGVGIRQPYPSFKLILISEGLCELYELKKENKVIKIK